MDSRDENRKKDAASGAGSRDASEGHSQVPEKPSPAEGDRETIDEDIEEKEAEGELQPRSTRPVCGEHAQARSTGPAKAPLREKLTAASQFQACLSCIAAHACGLRGFSCAAPVGT